MSPFPGEGFAAVAFKPYHLGRNQRVLWWQYGLNRDGESSFRACYILLRAKQVWAGSDSYAFDSWCVMLLSVCVECMTTDLYT